jgi:hypothetical protein
VLSREDSRRRAAVVKQFISVADVGDFSLKYFTHIDMICSVAAESIIIPVWLQLSQVSILLPSAGSSERGNKSMLDSCHSLAPVK